MSWKIKLYIGDNMSDYTHYDVYQPQGRDYYNSNDRRRTQYANNNQGNRGQRVPYNREQSTRQMGYPRTMVRIIQGNISIQGVDSLTKGMEMVTLEVSPRDINGE